MVWLCRQIGLPVDTQSSQRSLLTRFLAQVLPEGQPDAAVTVMVDEVDPDDRDHLDDLGELVHAAPPANRLAVLLLGAEDLPARLAAAGAPEDFWKDREPVLLRPLSQNEMVDYINFRMTAIGGGPKLSLDDATIFSGERASDLVALDDALTALAKLDQRKCRVVELRFFGGLSVEETSEALGISVATVGRELRMAQAWLHREMSTGLPK